MSLPKKDPASLQVTVERMCKVGSGIDIQYISGNVTLTLWQFLDLTSISV
jgi:hypothetical protein